MKTHKQRWKHCLKNDPTNWLLEEENPAVHYRTLIEILDKPCNDPIVRKTKRTIGTHPQFIKLFSTQQKNGCWLKQDYYLPKSCGTFWILSVLADSGLAIEDEHIRKACAYMFTQQRDNGSFCRHRKTPGKGWFWEEKPDPCTHARIIRFLIRFGYGNDVRIIKAFDWLRATQRSDAMWLCGFKQIRHGCLRATLDALSAAVLHPVYKQHAAMKRAAVIVQSLLMESGMGRFHVPDMWKILEYPYFSYGIIPALDTLNHFGYGLRHPKMRAGFDYLLSRQLPDGSWPLDRAFKHPPLDFGLTGKSNKWLTLDALRVIKMLSKN